MEQNGGKSHQSQGFRQSISDFEGRKRHPAIAWDGRPEQGISQPQQVCRAQKVRASIID
jgi:hypothetical protein